MKKIVFFDFDGTLKLKNKPLSKNLCNFINDFRLRNVFSTIITGKIFCSLKDSLEDNFPLVISLDSLIGLENGSKTVSFDGNIVSNFVFQDEEITKIHSFLFKNFKKIQFLSFSNGEDLGKGVMWFFEKRYMESIPEKYKLSFDFICSSFNEFFDTFLAYFPGKIAVKSFENLDFFEEIEGLTWSFNEGYLDINPAGVNKGSFVLKTLDMMNIDPENACVVGNDDNDMSMFKLGVGKKVFVLNGNDSSSINFEGIEFAKDPEDLVNVLKDFIEY